MSARVLYLQQTVDNWYCLLFHPIYHVYCLSLTLSPHSVGHSEANFAILMEAKTSYNIYWHEINPADSKVSESNTVGTLNVLP